MAESTLPTHPNSLREYHVGIEVMRLPLPLPLPTHGLLPALRIARCAIFSKNLEHLALRGMTTRGLLPLYMPPDGPMTALASKEMS